ncbi:hypothetical protein [Actinopolymorpha sp. B9G3]|uniref:hypothetical protein n=1 Tax=Actinopolymorpha sp. B9G3 TaxID=3158970 RepID=UPI0032D962F8
MNMFVRAIAGLAVAGSVSVATAVPSFAGPTYTVTTFQAGVTCTGATTKGDPVFATAGSSTDFGDFAFVRVGTDDDPLVEAFGTGSWNDGNLRFVLDVYSPEGEFVGTGDFAATTSITAQTETTDNTRNGNQHVRSESVASTLAADATLTLQGYDLGSLDCTGSSVESTYLRNAPESTVRFERMLFDSARCEGDAVVGVFGPAEGEYFLSMEVEHDGRQYNLFGPVDPSADSFTAVLPLRDSENGEFVAELPVSVTMAATGETTVSELRTSIARVVQKYTPYDVSATVDLPWGAASATCEHLEIVTRSVVTSPEGPKPAGPLPVNDRPEAATPLVLDETVRDTNRAAALEAEADVPCAWAPVERTLWYSVEGNGETLDIDTAGSDFDTVVAVYALTDGVMEPVVCGDDDAPGFPLPASTLQAQVDLPTVAGTTYYIQAGGLFGDYGRLVLSAAPQS